MTKTFGVNYKNKHPQVAALEEKYGKCAIKDAPWLYTEQQLVDFITRVAELDLDAIAQKIMKSENINSREMQRFFR